MTPELIVEKLKPAFPNATIDASGNGGKFEVRLVDEGFEGKRAVARQQSVYAPLNDEIASGAIHALTIKAFTPEEWRKASLFGG